MSEAYLEGMKTGHSAPLWEDAPPSEAYLEGMKTTYSSTSSTLTKGPKPTSKEWKLDKTYNRWSSSWRPKPTSKEWKLHQCI